MHGACTHAHPGRGAELRRVRHRPATRPGMSRATTCAPRGAQGGRQVACGTACNAASHGPGRDCRPRAG
eukprot:3121417-Pleurochrysis_carterae.AAC.3